MLSTVPILSAIVPQRKATEKLGVTLPALQVEVSDRQGCSFINAVRVVMFSL